MLIVFCLKAHLSHFPCFLCVWLVALLFFVVIFFDPCFLLCIFCRHFLCSYHELSLKHSSIFYANNNFTLIIYKLVLPSPTYFIFLIAELYLFIVTIYVFFLTQVREKAIFVQLLHCCIISLSMSLLFQAGFIVLHVLCCCLVSFCFNLKNSLYDNLYQV